MILFVAILLLTILLYLVTVVNLATMNQRDPAGNALSQSYAVFMAMGLWVLLAALALLGGLRVDLPGRAGIVALVLVPSSGVAAIAAVQLLSDNLYRSRWPILIPVLAPLVVIVFALWTLVPALRVSIPAGRGGFIATTALVLFSVAPWPALLYRRRHRTGDRATAEAARLERAREQNLAAFRRLSQESELSEWLTFLQPENELRPEALRGIRRLQRRQGDAEELMRRGLDTFWEDVPRLDLIATPVICERARHFLLERAADIRPPHPETPPRFALMAERVEPYLATMQWLVDQGCACDAELTAIETAVRRYPDSPERRHVLGALTGIRQSR